MTNVHGVLVSLGFGKVKGGAKVVKGQDLQNSLVNHGEVTHGYRMHREDLVKFGGHNWDDAIGKVVKVK